MPTVIEWLKLYDKLQANRPRLDIVDDYDAVTGEVRLSDTGMIIIDLFTEREPIVFSLPEFACLFRFYADFVGEGSFHLKKPMGDSKEKTPSQILEETARILKAKAARPVSNDGTEHYRAVPVTDGSTGEGPAEKETSAFQKGIETPSQAAQSINPEAREAAQTVTPKPDEIQV